MSTELNQVDDRELFRLGIRVSLAQWDALNLAIENGMGGRYTDDKLSWMIQVIAQYFRQNSGDFDSIDAELYLAEILNNEFDTIADDQSTAEVISALHRYFLLFQAQRYDELRNKLTPKISLVQSQQNKVTNVSEQKKLNKMMRNVNVDDEEMSSDDTSTDDSEEDEDDNMSDSATDDQLKTAGKSMKMAESAPSEQIENDGWTVIKRRN